MPLNELIEVVLKHWWKLGMFLCISLYSALIGYAAGRNREAKDHFDQ